MKRISFTLRILVLLFLGTRVLAREAKKECHSNEFTCGGSGKCVAVQYVCDKVNDCPDKTDEKDCPETCGHGTFLCRLSKQCIAAEKRCDGNYDCTLQDDEMDCKKACTSQEFRCLTQEAGCINNTKICDGNHDCSDGSDEKRESCTKIGRKHQLVCSHGEVPCKPEGLCLDPYFLCDKSKDCSDGSDEENCPRNRTSKIKATNAPVYKVECLDGYHKCKDDLCIPRNKICDGVSDCKDGEDESNCSLSCGETMFQCPNESKCINRSKKCDGKNDCVNGFDERNCSIIIPTTPSTTTTTTMPKQLKCNSSTHFDCDRNGEQCVPLSKVCDHHKDCHNGADEKGVNCNENTCNIKNGGCSHTCTYDLSLKKVKCSCPPGFHISKRNDRICEDINECLEWGRCSHTCKNIDGTFKCECPDGFSLPNRNSTSCVAEGDKVLMFSAQTGIRQYKFSLNELHLVNAKHGVTGFDIDQTKRPRVIYWSVSGKLGRLFMTNGEPKDEQLIVNENSIIDGLMFDWTNELLYWTDTGLDRIEAMNVTNGNRAVLLEGKQWMNEPRAIVVDPEKGVLYWSDWYEENPKISRMGMNGQDITVLLNKTQVRNPNALALDSDNDRLYYGDGDAIGCLDLKTGIHHNIIKKSELKPFTMVVFEDKIYWSDWRQNAVLSADKFTGNDLKPVAFSMKPMTLRMVNSNVQRRMKGRCHQNDCSHICLPSPKINPEYTCGCPEDMELNKDGKTCSKSKRKSSYIVKTVTNSETSNAKVPEIYADVGFIAGITIGIIVTVALGAVFLGIYLYVKYSKRIRTRTIHFDNAGLTKTSEDLFALTRSTSSMRSMKTVPSSSQPLWTYQTNNDLMEEMVGTDVKV